MAALSAGFMLSAAERMWVVASPHSLATLASLEVEVGASLEGVEVACSSAAAC